MGAEILAFSLNKDNPDHISAEDLKELKSWVEGVEFAVEVDHSELLALEEGSAFDSNLFLLNTRELASLRSLPGSLIISMEPEDLLHFDQGSYTASGLHVKAISLSIDSPGLLMGQQGLIDKLNSFEDMRVFVDMPELENNIEKVCELLPQAGFTLSGSKELKPGYKDFYELAPVLEYLEV